MNIDRAANKPTAQSSGVGAFGPELAQLVASSACGPRRLSLASTRSPS